MFWFLFLIYEICKVQNVNFKKKNLLRHYLFLNCYLALLFIFIIIISVQFR